MNEPPQSVDAARWLTVLAHEIRSPLAAILGYQELLAEGMLGDLPPAALDAAARIRAAALQLVALADGIDRVAPDPSEFDEPHTRVRLDELVADAVSAVHSDATARDVQLEHTTPSGTLALRRDEALRTLILALSAAIKVSAGSTLEVTALAQDDGAVVDIRGTRLDLRDDASSLDQAARSGAALRLFLARSTARAADARLTVVQHGDSTTLSIRFNAASG